MSRSWDIGANIDCGKVFHLALLSSAIFNENMIVFCEISLEKEEKIGVYTLAIYALNTKMKFCKNFLRLFFWRRRRFQSTPLEWEMMSSLLFSWFVRLEDDVLMLWAVDARRTWLEIRQGNMAKMRIQVFTMSCQYLNFNKSNCNVCQQHTLVTVTTPEEPPLWL